MEIADTGDLVYGDDGRVLLRKPIAYQVIADERRDITVSYRRRSDGAFSFAVGPYDRSQPLVIDPIVAYSFSFGGSGDERANDIAVDETGALYVGGETYSTNFLLVNPAQARDDVGDSCVFYGNSICRDSDDFDSVSDIAVDSSHALYFSGWTTTQTTNALPDVRNSFIGKLSPDGSQVLYKYVSPRCCAWSAGGPQLLINDLAVGPDGSAYVVTSTPTSSQVAVLPPTGTNYHALFTLTDPSGGRRTTFTSIAPR